MNFRYMVDYERILFVLAGFVGVFVGSALHNRIARKKSQKSLTDFQSFLFGTGFVYALLVVWLQVSFFLDYYLGTAFQGYNLRPDKNALFFAVFGNGVAGEDQFPLFAIDLNFICAMLGAAVGGVVLLAVKADRSKLQASDNGLFYGYRFQKLTPGGYIKREIDVLKSQITLPEYLYWWVVRIGMICVLIYRIRQGEDTLVLIISVNLAVSFVISLARFLSFPKLFFGNINYRVQSFIDIFVFFGSFLGHGFGLNGRPDYDKILHVVSGGIVVFIGWLLIEGTRRGKEIPRLSKTLASFGFSCVVMVVWEIFEFFTDFYMSGSVNQNWHYTPKPDMIFYRIFGTGAGKPGQSVVLDTNLDVFYALLGCILCTFLLYAFLSLRERQKEKAPAAKTPVKI